jgi:Zn-dependent peptidase ImmA (M78 family)
MDELRAVLKARQLVAAVNPTTIPVSIEAYAAKVQAVIRLDDELGPDEPGWSFPHAGKHHISVNANDTLERRRFTVCHELAHIYLGLPSAHKNSPWSGSYAKKSPEEIACDVFAAELLLPHASFKTFADALNMGFAAIESLRGDFLASITATGSRYVSVSSIPSAFVIAERGKVRYTSRSTALREAGAWISPRSDLPRDSLAARARRGDRTDGTESIEADNWFENWQRGGTLLEEVRHFGQWDQTLALLWFEEEEVPPARQEDHRSEDDELLRDLDGVLPWPGKKRRK